MNRMFTPFTGGVEGGKDITTVLTVPEILTAPETAKGSVKRQNKRKKPFFLKDMQTSHSQTV